MTSIGVNNIIIFGRRSYVVISVLPFIDTQVYYKLRDLKTNNEIFLLLQGV